jgi:hypothetical protein
MLKMSEKFCPKCDGARVKKVGMHFVLCSFCAGNGVIDVVSSEPMSKSEQRRLAIQLDDSDDANTNDNAEISVKKRGRPAIK